MYWVSDIDPHIDGAKLHVDKCFFVGKPLDNHVVRNRTGVTIQNVTLFPGTLTSVDAIKWGVSRILRQKWHGLTYKYRQIKKRFTF